MSANGCGNSVNTRHPQALKLVADLEEALTNHPAGADSLHLTWLGRLEEENP